MEELQRRRSSISNRVKVKNDSKKTKYPSRRIREKDHPEYKKWQFLRFIAHDLQNLGYEYFTEPIVDHQNSEFSTPEEAEAYISKEFNEWLENTQSDGRRLRKLLGLQKNVRNWLRNHIKNWDEIYENAKQAPILSNESIEYEQERLSEIACKLISDGHHDALYEELGEDVGEVIHDLQMVAEDYRLKRLRSEARAIRQKELDELKKYHEIEAQREKQQRPWPPGWTQSVKIKRNMEKKGNRYFYSIMRWLMDNRMKKEISEQLAGQKGWPLGLVLVEANLTRVSQKLGITRDAIFHHIKEMKRWGLIKKIGRPDRSRSNVYAIGYWAKRALIQRPVFWFKNTKEIKNVLINYAAY